jgi:Flp pilus assembly protein TadG
MKSWLFLDKLLPAHRRNQRGQTLVIFAFLAIFMILLLGLVLDSARLFILAAQAERVAEAASLAGALYMPDYFSLAAVTAAGNSPSPDGQYAEDRACAIARENGVSACPVGAGQIGADVETVPSNKYEIQVTVTLQADVFFLSYVAPGLSSATVSRTAVAQYLPPIQLGSRNYYFGDEIDTTNGLPTGTPLQNFWARLNGPLEIKDHGDAYTPMYQEGPDDARTTTDAASNVYNIDRFPTQFNVKTNHPQYGSPIIKSTNLDQQPTGFTGHNGVAGYNYEIVVPPGNTTNLEIQIYNPAFVNGINLDPAGNTTDQPGDACNDITYHPIGGSCKTDQPGEYLQMSYTVYYVPLPFERAQDQEKAVWPAPSLDMNSGKCTGGTPAYDPDGKTASLNGTPGCVALPSYIKPNTGSAGGYIAGWYPMQVLSGGAYTTYTFSAPGTYRLALEVTGGYGYHQYAVKVTDTSGNAPPTVNGQSTRLWAWNDMCVYYNQSGQNAIFDLGEIPAAYAGKTLTFSLFDPGDAGGDVRLEILDPNNNPVTFSSTQLPWLNLSGGGTQINASNGVYNALWLHLPIPIPATYNPTAGSDWWKIEYFAINPSDTVTASITLSGSPIHLVTEVVG